jgi:hypothetical protein
LKNTNRISNMRSFWTKITSNYNDNRFLLGKNNISTVNIIISYTTSFIGRNKWISKILHQLDLDFAHLEGNKLK